MVFKKENSMSRSLILGGTKGLGRAIAIGSLARGITPIVIGRTAKEAALDPELAGAEFHAADLSDPDAFLALMMRADRLLDLRYVFWVAGIFQRKSLYETTSDDLRSMIDIHLTGPLGALASIHRMMASAKPMSEPPGVPYHLVTIASTSSWRMRDNESVYCALKAAKAHFTRNFARELVASLPGSRATLINPGGMKTGLWENSGHPMPSGFMDPADVAKIIWEEVTGQTEPYREIQIFRNADGSARRERGPRSPEQPF